MRKMAALCAENAGAEGKIQRRSDPDEPGGDEALQGARRQSGWRMSADDDPDSDLLWSLHMLGQAAELRNATFLWVKDLSQPDTLFVIPGMGWVPILGIPGVGLPVNILPILMGATQRLAHGA